VSPRQPHARDLLIGVDRSESGSVSRQLEEQLRQAIRSGALPAGSSLPSTRVLAEDIGVSRGVVTRAYTQLAFEGYLLLRKGAIPTVRTSSQLDRKREAKPKNGDAASRIRYDLRAHLPEVASFPRKAWLRSVRDSLARARHTDLSYGDAAGLWELRVEVANYLVRARGVSAEPEQVVITGGSTHSLALIGRVLARRGKTQMAFENPSHYILHGVAESAGQEIVSSPVDDEGIRTDLIGEAQSVVVSPAHQFPSGVALSPIRRELLLTWARDTGGLIIEDDYDAEFRYDRAPIGALQGLDPEHVVYIGSTGKTLVPALRLGWAVLPESVIEDFTLELFSTMLHVSGMDQLAFADFLRRGEFDRHLRQMRAIYRDRRDLLVTELANLLPGLRISGIAAGLHVVLEMPSCEIAESVCTRARSRGVAVETISQHTLPKYNGRAGIILGYGSLSMPALQSAIEEFARTVADVMQEATEDPAAVAGVP